MIVHGEEVGDRIVGMMGGYIRWAGLVDDDTKAITITERIASPPTRPVRPQHHPQRHQAALTPRVLGAPHTADAVSFVAVRTRLEYGRHC